MSRNNDIRVYTLEVIYANGLLAPIKKPVLKLKAAKSRLSAKFARQIWASVQDQNYHILAVGGKVKYTDINPYRSYKFQGKTCNVKKLFTTLDLQYTKRAGGPYLAGIFAPADKRLAKTTKQIQDLHRQADRLYQRANAKKDQAIKLGGTEILDPQPIYKTSPQFYTRDDKVDRRKQFAADLLETYYDLMAQAEILDARADQLAREYQWWFCL